MRWIWKAAFAASITTAATGAARAQSSGFPSAFPSAQQGSQQKNGPLQNNPEPDDPLKAQAAAARERAQNNERQKRIVTDTEHLLKLAEELRAEVAKSNKNELSLDVIHKAEEIEKLAHDVKQRMKG